VGALHTKHTVLVPIFGGDISDDALSLASDLLARGGSRLMLLHVMPERDGAVGTSRERHSGIEPRWQRLTSAVTPDRTFVDAVVGDPADQILAEAERCHSDVIVLAPPRSRTSANAWIEHAIARLVRAAPLRVRVAEPRVPPPAGRGQRGAFNHRRSHVTPPSIRPPARREEHVAH
jgi:hypothetical protein